VWVVASLRPVLAMLAAAMVLAACAPPRPASVAGRADAGEYDALERETFQRVTVHRDSSGLPRLVWDERLAAIAREHSRAMAGGAVPFSHANFQQRAAMTMEMGYLHLGENVAFNDYPADTAAQVAVAGLVDSPPHRETLEGDWVRSGVGVARGAGGTWYFTQLFAR
jgi:uncharacterized protein YkwD